MGVGELNQILCQKQNNKTKQKLNALNYQVTSLAKILSEDKIVFNICACGAHMLWCAYGKIKGQLSELVLSFHSGIWRGLGLSGCPSVTFTCWANMQARFWNLKGYLRVLSSQRRSHVVSLKEQDKGAMTLILSYCDISAMFYLLERLGFIPRERHCTRMNSRQQGPPKAGLEDVCRT